jgi:endonuclease YncB( thermonuclease family)
VSDQNRARVIFAAVAVLCLSRGAPAQAQDTLRGKANVVDGDTIEIAGIPVRLDGIDAPEQRQSCTTNEGGSVACGKWRQRRSRR